MQRGLGGLGLGGVGRFQNSGGGLGVQGFADSKVLGLGFWCQSGAVLSSGEFRSTKACALSCVVFVCVGFCICFVSGLVMHGMFDVCVV